MTDTSVDEHAAAKAALMELLAPILAKVAELGAVPEGDGAAGFEASLAEAFPADGEHVTSLGRAIASGVKDGWLCDRGGADSRFSRVAKPSNVTHDLSIDVVDMTGPGLEHTHPQGEITIGFASEGSDAGSVTFEGRPPGWVVLGPGTRHVPTVEGGRMQLMYFLPAGAVEWHKG